MLNFSVTYKKPDEDLKDLNNAFLEHNKIIMNIQDKLNTNYKMSAGAYSDNVYRDPYKLLEKMTNYYKPNYVQALSKPLEFKPNKLDVDIERVFDNILKDVKQSDKISKVKPTKVKVYKKNDYPIIDYSKFLISKEDRAQVIEQLFDKSLEEKILARRKELTDLGLKTDDIDRVIKTNLGLKTDDLTQKIDKFDEVKKNLLKIYGTLETANLSNPVIIDKIENAIDAINKLQAKIIALPLTTENIVKEALEENNIETPEDLQQNKEVIKEIGVEVDDQNTQIENEANNLGNNIEDIKNDVNEIANGENVEPEVANELNNDADTLEEVQNDAFKEPIPDITKQEESEEETPEEQKKLEGATPEELEDIIKQELSTEDYIKEMSKFKNILGANYDNLINILTIIRKANTIEDVKDKLKPYIKFEDYNENSINMMIRIIEGYKESNVSSNKELVDYTVGEFKELHRRYKDLKNAKDILNDIYITANEGVYKPIIERNYKEGDIDINDTDEEYIKQQLNDLNT
jgi:hypothetical protein